MKWNALPDALITAGAIAVACGVWLIYAPAGYIVAGAECIAIGWLLSRVDG